MIDYADTKKIRKGDTPTFSVTLVQADGSTAYNLTGKTVTFQAKENYFTNEEIFSKTCTIVSAAAGTITTTLASTDTAQEGEFIAQFKIAASGVQLTSTPFKLIIEPNIFL